MSVSNHQRSYCLFKSLLRLTTKKTSKLPTIPHFCRGIDRWEVDSPHKNQVMWKVFPCRGVLMKFNICQLTAALHPDIHPVRVALFPPLSVGTFQQRAFGASTIQMGGQSLRYVNRPEVEVAWGFPTSQSQLTADNTSSCVPESF